MAPSAVVADVLQQQQQHQRQTEQDASVSLKSTKSVKPTDAVSHVHGMTNMRPLEAFAHGEGLTLPGIPQFPTFAATRQWQLEHMAAVFRHWAREGFVEGISGHISVRDPEMHDAFWTNPLGKHFGLLKASDMILVDLKGKVVGGNRSRPANAAGFLIHAAVHEARPDVHAVCHAHTVYGKAWSVFGRELEMLTQDSCKFYKAHSVYNSYGGVVLAAEEGKLIAQALGKHKACILRNHGLLTVGGTVDEAAFLFLSMEHACQGQLLCDAAVAGSSSRSRSNTNGTGDNDNGSGSGSGSGSGGLKKILITDEEAEYVFNVESDPEICYHEFGVYYEYEDYMCKGDFKN